VILACTVFVQSQSVTDRRTNGRTDRHLDDGKTREALNAVARKKQKKTLQSPTELSSNNFKHGGAPASSGGSAPRPQLPSWVKTAGNRDIAIIRQTAVNFPTKKKRVLKTQNLLVRFIEKGFFISFAFSIFNEKILTS